MAEDGSFFLRAERIEMGPFLHGEPVRADDSVILRQAQLDFAAGMSAYSAGDAAGV